MAKKRGPCIALAALMALLFPAALAAQDPPRRRDLGNLMQLSASFQALARRVSPSVVKVLSIGYKAPDDEDDTEGLAARQPSSGSGVIVDPQGYIITNAHVVLGSERVQVLLPLPLDQNAPRQAAAKPKGRMLRAEVVGIDVETDIAVLKVESQALPYLELGDSDAVEQGQLVLALGSPLGLENSLSMGVVSSSARQLRGDDSQIYIQTDAPINPGNSGGPLVDTSGRVIGINTLLYSQSGGNEGIGFAVPSSLVRVVLDQIRQHGRVVRADIGAETQTITPLLAGGWRLPQTWGVVVSDIVEEGAAEQAGLRVGDIIASVNGKTMENARQFALTLYRPKPGETARLTILRGAQQIQVSVPLTEKLADPERLASLLTRGQTPLPQLGVLAVDLTSKLTDTMTSLRGETGVLVAGRTSEAPFMEGAFKAGDVIYSINRERVTSIADLKTLLARLKTGDPVAVQIERAGRLMFVALEMP
mgnify:CR=1 FL=1